MDDLLNLMQLRAFVRVAELGSVTRASDSLCRAQSVVTRAIADLESHLGVSVFERHATGMSLSSPGLCILPRAQRVFEELNDAARACGGKAGEPLYLYQTRRLQILAKLYQSCHMPTVAASMGITQPAVSSALKALESGCGKALFERCPKGLRPTRANFEMITPIRRALNELRHLLADLHAVLGEVRGTVHIGALPLGRTAILPEAIVRLTCMHPKVQIVTNESPFEQLAADLRSGDLDFMFGALRTSEAETDLKTEALLTERLVILGRRGHPLVGCDLKRIRSALWVLPRAGSPGRKLIDEHFIRHRVEPPAGVVESGDLAVIRGLLTKSEIVAAVSAHQLQYEIDSGELVELAPPLENTSRPIGLIYRKGFVPSPVVESLMNCIRDVVSQRH